MATEDRGPQVMAVAILFLVLTWALTMLRCYVRVSLTRLFRSDDWFALVTLGAYTLYCSFVLAGAKYGTGRHLVDLSEEDIVTSMKWWYCGEITYVLTTCLVKVYVGIFLGQICIDRAQIIVIWTVCVTFSTFSVYYLFLLVFQCHPVSYFWIRFIPGSPGSCLPLNVIVDSTYAHGVLSAIVDWTLGTIPIFIVWNLRLNIRGKVSVAMILALGATGSIATVIRIPYIHQLAHTTDFLFDNTGVAIWSTVEPGMGIVAFSLACLRPLFRSIYQRSAHLGSLHTTTFPESTSRPRYVSNKSQNHLGDIPLPKMYSNSIHVTTVIDTYSSRKMSSDVELGIGGHSQEGSEITIMPIGEDGWNEGSSSDSTFKMGPIASRSEGVSAVCEAGTTNQRPEVGKQDENQLAG